eukprot:g4040.t1
MLPLPSVAWQASQSFAPLRHSARGYAQNLEDRSSFKSKFFVVQHMSFAQDLHDLLFKHDPGKGDGDTFLHGASLKHCLLSRP